MNNHQLIKDVFYGAEEFHGFLIAYNSNHLVILDSKGDLILSWVCKNEDDKLSLYKPQ